MEDRYKLALHFLTINNTKHGVYCDPYQRCPHDIITYIKANKCTREINCKECWDEFLTKKSMEREET